MVLTVAGFVDKVLTMGEGRCFLWSLTLLLCLPSRGMAGMLSKGSYPLGIFCRDGPLLVGTLGAPPLAASVSTLFAPLCCYPALEIALYLEQS